MRPLPDVALRAIRPDGSTDVVTLLRAVLRQPGKFKELLQIALDARSARATLLQCCRVLNPNRGRAEAGGLDALGAVPARLGPAIG
jgi:hypothetical protein